MVRFLLAGALGIATVGAAQDIRGGRIPNWLTYGGLVAALLIRPLVLGWPGLKGGLIGMLAGGAIFFVFFVLGGMGGGDVKLMAAVAAWAGGAETMNILIATAVAGGVLALGAMLLRRQVRVTLLNTVELIRHHLTAGFKPHPELNIRDSRSMRIPFGPAIALGTLYCLCRTFPWG